VSDIAITGKVAQFGRGALVDVSSKLMGQFVENLERDVLTTAGGGDTSHAGGAYEQALESVIPAPATAPRPEPVQEPVQEPAPERATGPRRIDSPEAEPIDLMEMAGGSLARRLVPVGVAVVVLVVAWRLVRRGRG